MTQHITAARCVGYREIVVLSYITGISIVTWECCSCHSIWFGEIDDDLELPPSSPTLEMRVVRNREVVVFRLSALPDRTAAIAGRALEAVVSEALAL